ncbi:MAG: FMN-binding glutamate synthase family protein [Hafnia sp.]
MKILNSRYYVFAACVAIAVIGLPLSFLVHDFVWVWLVACALTALGIRDMKQVTHAVRSNYPIIGNIRYLFEDLRAPLRQYLFESDLEEVPFSRAQRTLVYARAKNEPSEKAFGTNLNVYEEGFEFIGHSMIPAEHADPKTFRVTIGGDQCVQPYSASIFNISAMSFGSLSANAILSLNKGAEMGGFYHDTGEGSISKYHREYGGDLVWELGSGYFGARDPMGNFCPSRFAEQAVLPQVKMIEIKLSQGAKPGHGGILPGPKVSEEIAQARGVPVGVDCISPASHSAFRTPIELMEFIQKLRELSGGKPVGFKLCIGHPWEFMAIAKAMLQTGILPDFIVVDGKEGGTGAAPREFADHIGMPMKDGLLFIHNTLVGLNLRDKIKIGASGKIVSAFDIAGVLAIGADWCNSARGFMFSLGCISAGVCGTGACPSGVATQDPIRQRALDVGDKSVRVKNFHEITLKALSEMIAAAGLSNPSQMSPEHMVRRISASEIKHFSELYYFMSPGALLEPVIENDFYARMWSLANAESF